MTRRKANRLRWKRERLRALDAEKAYLVYRVWPSHVIFRYYGHYIKFVPHEHTIAMLGGDTPFIPPEDHAFLFSQAAELLRAAQAAAKDTQRKKAKPDPLPYEDPRQITLL